MVKMKPLSVTNPAQFVLLLIPPCSFHRSTSIHSSPLAMP